MRMNLPVTDVETIVREDQYLISKTDMKGRIIYANPAFVEVSGFSREELIGKAHNLIRHPDMPAAAFADLWKTLQAGEPWLGLVKNRRKDGGFYWVLANAYPVVENGQITCYASVRVQPTREQIQQAQAFYADVNAQRKTGYTVKRGQIVPTGWRHALTLAATPFRKRLRASMFRMAVMASVAIGIASYFAATGGVSGQAHWYVWPVLAALTIGTFGYGWLIAKRITTSLKQAARIARQVAAGNLNAAIDGDCNDELGRLRFYLDIMRKSLISLSNDVQAGVTGTGHAAQVLFANNSHLSTRTEDQASSLQETAAAMEELTVTVKQNSDNAATAAELADDSTTVAQRGGNEVAEVVQTMDGIRDSSRKIADIVTLIEGIAFQTNILALNAAVESARAGEAGKSFAVVAGEVRNLALKSSQAAKEVKTLIDESNGRINLGATQATRAGDTMRDIVDSSIRVAKLMSEISMASVEQSVGLEQINEAISQLDSATHQNTTLVHDLGQTVRALSGEASNLGDAIGVFNSHLQHQGRPAKVSQGVTATSASHSAPPSSASARSARLDAH